MDEGFLQKKQHFPLTAYAFTDLEDALAAGIVELGPLTCSGKKKFKLILFLFCCFGI